MAWKDVYLESRVLSADPIELIRILYEHALQSLADARLSLAGGDIAGRSKSISRVIAILSELEGSLDHEVGGPISRNLADLYQYMRQRLLESNLRQEDAPLAEVESLLRTLGEAWKNAQPASPAPEPVREFSAFTPEPEAEHAGHAWSA